MEKGQRMEIDNHGVILGNPKMAGHLLHLLTVDESVCSN